MAIEYLEIRDINREIIGVIDTAKSIIWHSVYYGVGDFEIYAKATPEHLDLLQEGRYVTRNDDIEVGIIESIVIEYSMQDGTMIVASGRFAKSMLDRRLIYKLSGKTNTPSILRGKVEENIRRLVSENAISCSFDARRNIPVLELGALIGYPQIIVDEYGNATEKQVSYHNLLDYTDAVLQEYQMSALVIIDKSTNAKKLQYIVTEGIDRSIDNLNGLDPVVFSKDFDNLLESEYLYDKTAEKNAVLIGGEGEGLKRFYSLVAPADTGLSRREVFLDASSINKTYEDENEEEHEYTDAEYKKMLDAQGKQTLASLRATERFAGSINVTSGNYILNTDFNLGDIVTVEEKSINKNINVRIVEITEVQDENGYTIDAKYE